MCTVSFIYGMERYSCFLKISECTCNALRRYILACKMPINSSYFIIQSDTYYKNPSNECRRFTLVLPLSNDFLLIQFKMYLLLFQLL